MVFRSALPTPGLSQATVAAQQTPQDHVDRTPCRRGCRKPAPPRGLSPKSPLSGEHIRHRVPKPQGHEDLAAKAGPHNRPQKRKGVQKKKSLRNVEFDVAVVRLARPPGCPSQSGCGRSPHSANEERSPVAIVLAACRRQRRRCPQSLHRPRSKERRLPMLSPMMRSRSPNSWVAREARVRSKREERPSSMRMFSSYRNPPLASSFHREG